MFTHKDIQPVTQNQNSRPRPFPCTERPIALFAVRGRYRKTEAAAPEALPHRCDTPVAPIPGRCRHRGLRARSTLHIRTSDFLDAYYPSLIPRGLSLIGVAKFPVYDRREFTSEVAGWWRNQCYRRAKEGRV